MNAQRTVRKLGRRIGLTNLSLDNEGRAAFSTQGIHIELHVADDDDTTLHFITAIGKPRNERPTELMYRLLNTNSEATAPCTPVFAFDRANREIVLTVSLPVCMLPIDTVERSLHHMIERTIVERARLADSGLQI